jgi:hypothetical protein
VSALADLLAAAVVAGIKGVISALGPSTEPDFGSIAGAYNRMLAISLLLVGAVIAAALIERLLRGPLGGGWNLVGRSATGVAAAFMGLPLLRYLAGYAALLGAAWGADYAGRAHDLGQRVVSIYTSASLGHQALGSALGLVAAGGLSLLLVLILEVELFLRAALLLVASTFVPFLAVLAIWPRFVSAAVHLVDFLTALLLSKFVIATSVYVGFAVLVAGLGRTGPGGGNVMVTGIAILAVAALAPLALFQGIRFGHHATAPLARSWTASGLGFAALGGRRVLGAGRQGYGLLRTEIRRRRGPGAAPHTDLSKG